MTIHQDLPASTGDTGTHTNVVQLFPVEACPSREEPCSQPEDEYTPFNEWIDEEFCEGYSNMDFYQGRETEYSPGLREFIGGCLRSIPAECHPDMVAFSILALCADLEEVKYKLRKCLDDYRYSAFDNSYE